MKYLKMANIFSLFLAANGCECDRRGRLSAATESTRELEHRFPSNMNMRRTPKVSHHDYIFGQLFDALPSTVTFFGKSHAQINSIPDRLAERASKGGRILHELNTIAMVDHADPLAVFEH